MRPLHDTWSSTDVMDDDGMIVKVLCQDNNDFLPYCSYTVEYGNQHYTVLLIEVL